MQLIYSHSRLSWVGEGFKFGGGEISSLLFADSVVLLASSTVTSSSCQGGAQPSVKRLG